MVLHWMHESAHVVLSEKPGDPFAVRLDGHSDVPRQRNQHDQR